MPRPPHSVTATASQNPLFLAGSFEGQTVPGRMSRRGAWWEGCSGQVHSVSKRAGLGRGCLARESQEGCLERSGAVVGLVGGQGRWGQGGATGLAEGPARRPQGLARPLQVRVPWLHCKQPLVRAAGWKDGCVCGCPCPEPAASVFPPEMWASSELGLFPLPSGHREMLVCFISGIP